MSENKKQDVSGGGSCESGGGGAETIRPGKFGFKVRLNRQAREFRVCLTRATAGVGFAAVCGVLVGVVATTRHVANRGPEAARADVRDIAEVKPHKEPKPSLRPATVAQQKAAAAAGKPQDVKAPELKSAAPAVALTTTRPALVKTVTPTPAPKSAKPVAVAAPVASVAAPVEAGKSDSRTAGHQYLVLGSYPSLKDASAACARLNKDGIACTAEKSLPGWTKKGWFSVVTVKGFATQDRAYERQVRAIESKGYEAHAYRWRAPKS